MTAIAIAVGVLVVLAVGVFLGALWQRRTRSTVTRSRRTSATRETAVLATTTLTAPAQVVADREPEPDKVAIRLLSADTALVFGESSDVAVIGGKLDSLPDAVSQGLAVGNAALQGVMAAGQASGQLVRLTAESAAALKALGPMVDSSGAILGVVRDGSGQFAKVLRFTSVDRLSAVASLGPALTSLALQMQLQAISKQLQEVKRIAESVAQHQKDELVASVETNIDILSEAYRKLLKTGTISAIDSAGLTQIRKSLGDDVRLIAKKIDAGIDGLNGVAWNGSHRWAGDRLSMLDAIERHEKPLMWVDLYVHAQRAVVMGEFLRVHQFIAADDPHLDVHRLESEQRVKAALEEMQFKFNDFEKAIEDAGSGDVSSWNPIRNGWNDKRPALRKRLADLHEVTVPVRQAVRQALITVGGDVKEIDAGPGEPADG